jgi:hypothetical protein
MEQQTLAAVGKVRGVPAGFPSHLPSSVAAVTEVSELDVLRQAAAPGASVQDPITAGVAEELFKYADRTLRAMACHIAAPPPPSASSGSATQRNMS